MTGQEVLPDEDPKDIGYHLFILKRMAAQLGPASVYFLDEIAIIQTLLLEREKDNLSTARILSEQIANLESNVGLCVRMLQHDLDATRRERDAYRKKCEDNGL